MICGATVVLREAGTAKVFPGTYVFPFEIDLPVTLPSSTTGGDGIGNCSIYYRLAVDAYHNGSSQSPKIVKSYFNVASAPLPDELAPALVSPRSLRVESFGVNRGTLGVAARVVDVHVGRGTDLKLYLACRNDATASIYQFKVELVESLEWYGDRSRQSNSSTKILAQLSDVDLPGILRGKKDKQEVREDIRRGGVASHELEWLYGELQSENNMVTLTVPFGCRDTYSGTLIKISHYLKITMFTHAMVSNPSVQIPLRIGFPPRLQRQESPRPLRPSEPAMLPQVSGQSPSSSFATPAFAPTEPAPIASAEPYPLPMAQPYDTPRSLSIRSLPDMEIPMAEAFIIPIDDDAVQHPFASAPPEGLVLGGDAIYSEVESSIEAQPVALPSSAPAMDGLLREMLYSIDDFGKIFSFRASQTCFKRKRV